MTWERERFAAWVKHIESEVRQREVAIRLVLLAMVSRNHVLLLGPPGTGKSMLADRATKAMDGKFFSTLLTRFSVPEDVLGPLSLKGLEEGRYERLVDGYLPAADVAFVDEIYKANASILNSLLSILNERVFFDGSARREVPLRSIVAASNEVPEEDAGLDALDDRLLLRVMVERLSERTLFELIRGKRSITPAPREPFNSAWLSELDRRASAVRIGEDVTGRLLSVVKELRSKTIDVSDRRLMQTACLLRYMAALDGEDEVLVSHLGITRFLLWRRPDQYTKADAAITGALAGHAAIERATSLFVQKRNEISTQTNRYHYGGEVISAEQRAEVLAKVRLAFGELKSQADNAAALSRSENFACFWPASGDRREADSAFSALIDVVQAVAPDFAADLRGAQDAPGT